MSVILPNVDVELFVSLVDSFPWPFNPPPPPSERQSASNTSRRSGYSASSIPKRARGTQSSPFDRFEDGSTRSSVHSIAICRRPRKWRSSHLTANRSMASPHVSGSFVEVHRVFGRKVTRYSPILLSGCIPLKLCGVRTIMLGSSIAQRI